MTEIFIIPLGSCYFNQTSATCARPDSVTVVRTNIVREIVDAVVSVWWRWRKWKTADYFPHSQLIVSEAHCALLPISNTKLAVDGRVNVRLGVMLRCAVLENQRTVSAEKNRTAFSGARFFISGIAQWVYFPPLMQVGKSNSFASFSRLPLHPPSSFFQ